MELFLSSESTIREINKEFQKNFPFLKLEFYKQHSKTEQYTYWKDKLSGHVTLKETGSKLIPAIIKIDPTDTVNEMERRLRNNYGLLVQVLRKSGDVWLETVQTNDFTLERQNSIGATVPKQRYNIHTLFL
jgi:hypothetical protein